MREKLSEAEIKKRLQKLRNYERLYPELRKKYEKLKKEFKAFKQQTAENNMRQFAIIEAQALRIEGLEKKVFGKKKRKPKDDEEDSEPPKQSRSKKSYRRPTPQKEEITKVNTYSLNCCPDCGESLMKHETIVRYLEDIVLPLAENNPLKKVEKQLIERGYCKKCRKTHAAIPLSSQVCRLGNNVRAFLAYQIINLGLSYEKVACLLRDVFGISISDGEIFTILKKESRKLYPEYEAINARIRGSPSAHYDETSYKIQAEKYGSFAWVKTASNTFDTLFLLGRTRGKGNAEKLRGADSNIMVTDDYPAYKNLAPEKHALCWTHPYRKFRDLAQSKTFTQKKQQACRNFYAKFCELYQDVASIHSQPFNLDGRKLEAAKFLERIEKLFVSQRTDPQKLTTLKETFRANKEKYMTCLLHKDVSMDNNKAERSLRPLVIKRKISFGSKTQQGANVMEVLCSVLFSLWWKKPKNFFAEYKNLVRT